MSVPGHINALLVVVIAALTLFFCGCNHVLSFWVMLLPLCFLPGNVFSGWQFCALLVGLCLLSRIGSKQLCVLYGVYYSLLALVSGFGGVFAFHYRRVYYTNAQAYLRSLNFKQMYQALLRCNITALIIVIAVYGVLAAALLYLFAKVRLGKKLAFDAADGLKFLIAAAALTAAVFGTAMVFAVDDALPVGAIVLQMVAAYLISRPFASETMVHKLSAGDAAMEGSKNAVSNAEITFDKWDSIAGYEETKKEIQSIIRPYTDKREYDRLVKAGMAPVKGLLLFGPPGTGKTFFAKVAADESKAAFYVVNGPELLGRGVGESEENLRKAFMDARETKPSILFFDEIDAIAEARSTNAGSVRIINQLLTEMDGMESLSGVTVIAATNRPESLDPALLRAGRFDTKIYIPLPDQDSIRQMVLGYLGDVPNDADVDAVTAALAGYTCADVAAIINKAKVLYVHRSVAGKEEPLHTGEILDIISRAKSSVSPEDAAAYEKQRSLESWT